MNYCKLRTICIVCATATWNDEGKKVTLQSKLLQTFQVLLSIPKVSHHSLDMGEERKKTHKEGLEVSGIFFKKKSIVFYFKKIKGNVRLPVGYLP